MTKVYKYYILYDNKSSTF